MKNKMKKCAITKLIQPEELEKLFEGDQHGIGNLMKSIWFTDKQHQSAKFSSDQIRNSKFYILHLTLP